MNSGYLWGEKRVRACVHIHVWFGFLKQLQSLVLCTASSLVVMRQKVISRMDVRRRTYSLAKLNHSLMLLNSFENYFLWEYYILFGKGFSWIYVSVYLWTEKESLQSRQQLVCSLNEWQMSFLCTRVCSQIPELSSEPGNNGDSRGGSGI